MIIPNMYNIKISCKDENDNVSYNIDIDTDVTVTATVLDFNGEPVIGKSLTIYYDDETSIYTGTTDSNGQISTTYTCAEWGTHIFSVETYSCQINVTGLKQVKQRVWSSTINLTYTLYVDEANRHCTVTINGSGISISSGLENYEVTNFVPTEYRSKGNKYFEVARTNNFRGYMWSTGTIGISNFATTTQTGQRFGGEMDWNY